MDAGSQRRPDPTLACDIDGDDIHHPREKDDVLPDGGYRSTRHPEELGQLGDLGVEVYHIGSFGRDVRSGSRNRDAHIGCGEGRRVIDPVSDHRDFPALQLKLLDAVELLLRQQLRLHVSNAHHPSQCIGRLAPVTRQQDDVADAVIFDFVDGVVRSLSWRVPQQDCPCERVVVGN